MISKGSIVKIISIIKDFKALIIKRFWVLVIYVVLGALIGFFLAYRSEKMYTAKLTFMMDGGNKGGMASAYAGIARQFGVGGGGGEALSSEKIVELVKSKKIVSGGLLMEAIVDGKKDLLINHYLEKVIYKDFPRKNPISFSKNQNFTIQQDSVMDIVYARVMTGFTSLLSKKDGIITLSFSSYNQDIAIAFLNNTLTSLTSFFTKKSVEKEQKTVNLMTNKVDSLLTELQITEHQLANVKDHSNAVRRAEGMLDEIKLTRKVRILNILYGEGVKNLEIARFSLMEKEVIIQKDDMH